MAKKALCIGINNYPGTHMDLQGCVNDAQDWAATLAARGFKTTTLVDGQATKAAMVAAMADLIGKGAKGDTLVITYSGHGTYQPDENGDETDGLDEALCPYDLQTKGEALTDDEIHIVAALRRLKKSLHHPVELVSTALRSVWEGREAPPAYLARLGLDEAKGFKGLVLKKLFAGNL